MKKVFLVYFIIIAAALASVLFFYNKNNVKEISQLVDNDIILLLRKNSDAKEYMQKNTDFKIESREILTKEAIIAGQKGQNFKEVYQDLTLEDNRYIKVNLMNTAGDKGLVAVIDYKMQATLKAYGILLLKSGSQ